MNPIHYCLTLLCTVVVSIGTQSLAEAQPRIPLIAQSEAEAEDWFEQGLEKLEGQDYQGAIEDLSTAIRILPHDPSPYVSRGIARQKQGNYDEAIADFNQAITLNPNFSAASNALGDLHREQGHLQDAIAAYEKARDARANNNLGMIYYEQGDDNKANDYFNRAIALDNEFPEAYNNRGTVRMKREQWLYALSDFRAAIDLDPNNANFYYNRALAYLQRGEAEDDRAAADDLTQAIELEPDNADFYYNRAIAYLQQGEEESLELAQTDFERAEDLYQQEENQVGLQNIRIGMNAIRHQLRLRMQQQI